MMQSYSALQSVKEGLEGSLKNPNLDANVRNFAQEELNKANAYINKIEDLFRPFVGVE